MQIMLVIQLFVIRNYVTHKHITPKYFYHKWRYRLARKLANENHQTTLAQFKK